MKLIFLKDAYIKLNLKIIYHTIFTKPSHTIKLQNINTFTHVTK